MPNRNIRKCVPGTLAEDLTGLKFDTLTCLELQEIRNGRGYWLCACECGKKIVKSAKLLKNGHTKTCGDRKIHCKHGKSKSRLFSIWQDMKNRCYNPNLRNYHRYGGRGIKVCPEWMNDFTAFYNWSMENGYKDSLTLDRIDNDGDYEPSNCRWATRKEQGNNRSTNRRITINDVSKTLQEWSQESGIPERVLSWRVRAGWEPEDLLIHILPTGKKIKRRKRTNEDHSHRRLAFG